MWLENNRDVFAMRVSILKKKLDMEASIYEILQMLSVMLFEKTSVKACLLMI